LLRTGTNTQEGDYQKSTPVETLWPVFQDFTAEFPEACRVA